MIHMLNTFHSLSFPSLFMCVFDHIDYSTLFYKLLKIHNELRHKFDSLTIFSPLKKINSSNCEQGYHKKSKKVDLQLWNFSQNSQNP